MAYLLLSAVTLVLVLTGFNKVYCIHGIDQVYLGLYKGLFDETVAVVDENGDYLPKPKFYVPKIRFLVNDYLKVNLTPYCRSYTHTVTVSGTDSTDYGDRVVVAFTAKINDIDRKRKVAIFSIERGDL
ncbi:MAG: hypothetical protein IJS37_01340 [Bacilli bacterium]|nr:hypothetical protein [Bacilli bacterium]